MPSLLPCSSLGSFLLCQNNASLSGLQTLQGECLKIFILLLCVCGEKKKKRQPNNFSINTKLCKSFVWLVCLQNLFGSKLLDNPFEYVLK